jgi:hypothetical protein
MSNSAGGDEAAGAFRKAIEKGAEAQRDFIRNYSAVQQDAIQNFFSTLQGLTYYNAMFKTTVQTGGRISIPEAERHALNIGDGDLVQVIIIPIHRKKDSNPE